VSLETVIRCENLTHTYPNGVQALCDLDLEIQKGEYVALVGQNGSGKTTLAKHFNGLLLPASGSVTVMGTLTTEGGVSRLFQKVGYVFQNPDDMLFCSSVEEEIGYGLKMMSAPAAEITARVDAVIRELGLEDLRREHPFALSLGDRQRVAVACVMCLEPEIFVFDEPTTGQDYYGGERIMSLIDQLHHSGRTIVIITHDMPLVAEHARRVVVMQAGKIACQGTPGEVFARAALLRELSLRPPQVTLLAQKLDPAHEPVLNVSQMVSWILGTAGQPSAGGIN